MNRLNTLPETSLPPEAIVVPAHPVALPTERYSLGLTGWEPYVFGLEAETDTIIIDMGGRQRSVSAPLTILAAAINSKVSDLVARSYECGAMAAEWSLGSTLPYEHLLTVNRIPHGLGKTISPELFRESGQDVAAPMGSIFVASMANPGEQLSGIDYTQPYHYFIKATASGDIEGEPLYFSKFGSRQALLTNLEDIIGCYQTVSIANVSSVTLEEMQPY